MSGFSAVAADKFAYCTDTERQDAAFLSAFQGIPKRNCERLAKLANTIVDDVGEMQSRAKKLYKRHGDIMVEVRCAYTVRINPSTSLKET